MVRVWTFAIVTEIAVGLIWRVGWRLEREEDACLHSTGISQRHFRTFRLANSFLADTTD